MALPPRGMRSTRTFGARFRGWGLAAALVISILAAITIIGTAEPAAAVTAPLAIDVQVSTHQSSSASTITSPTFSTHQTNEVLLAFLASDGPKTANETFSTVTGGGVTWTLRARSNTQAGTAEIWQANAPQLISNASITATRASGTAGGSITVAAFSGADATKTGATASASASSGGPTASLTTTVDGSWVWGVGDDWDKATARVPGANQNVADQYLASTGDTYWVQRQNTATSTAGTSTTINDTAPTADRWNLALIEVVPGSSTSTPPPDPPSSLSANVVSGTEIDLAWTASPTAGVAGYTIYRNGASVGTSQTTSYSDTTVSPGTTYTYTVSAYDSQGNASGPSNSVTATTPALSTKDVGQWGPVLTWPIVAVHAALMSNGKVLTWGNGASTPTLWDPSSNAFTAVPNAFANPMCGGLNVLPDGRVITIGGGGLPNTGIKTVTAFAPSTGKW